MVYADIKAQLKAWASDTSDFVNLQVESSTSPNLRVAIASGNTVMGLGQIDSDGVGTTLDSLPSRGFLYGFNGSTWDRLRVQSSAYPNLRISIFDGDAYTTVFTGGSDGRGATNYGVCSQSFLYGFNGTDWDRLRVDANKYLYVNLGADSVGLATESTLSTINGKIIVCDTSNISGTILSQLQGYQSGVASWVNLEADSNKYLYINLGATSITLPVDVQANLMQQLDYTTTALGSGSTYTGDSVEVDKYTRLCGTVIADQDGTVYIDQSSDGSNWDYTSSFDFTAGNGLAFSVEVIAPYGRLRVTNTSGSAQTYLRAYMFGKVIN